VKLQIQVPRSGAGAWNFRIGLYQVPRSGGCQTNKHVPRRRFTFLDFGGDGARAGRRRAGGKQRRRPVEGGGARGEREDKSREEARRGGGAPGSGMQGGALEAGAAPDTRRSGPRAAPGEWGGPGRGVREEEQEGASSETCIYLKSSF
jgi:hypothetical protein